MTPHGPIYCETGHPWLFIAEPVNTLTNAFIILAAYLAFRHVRRARIGYPADLVVLLLLLVVNGIGSFLWHGLRTQWALQLDWIPGVLFLFAITAFWLRMLFGWLAGFFGAVGMFAAAVGSVVLAWRLTGGTMPHALVPVPAFVTITIIALAMVAATRRKFGVGAMQLGAVVLLCAASAGVFRSIDLLTCAIIPFGTHFLWHILLSTSAYLGIVLLVRMKKHPSTGSG